MDSLMKFVMTIMGLLFGVIVLGFTGFQTWELLYEVSGNPYIATLGLFIFGGGMVYWWLVFQYAAEGLGQMAVSLLTAVFNLLLEISAVAIHLGAVDSTLFGPSTPAKLITIAAIVNLVAKFTMPLLGPHMMQNIYEKAMEGMLMLQSFANFRTKVDEIAADLSDGIAETMRGKMRTKLITKHEVKELPAQASQPTQVNGRVRPTLVAQPVRRNNDQPNGVASEHYVGSPEITRYTDYADTVVADAPERVNSQRPPQPGR